MKALLAGAALALAACVQPEPEPRPFERAAGAAVLRAWAEAGLPKPDHGRCNMSLFRVVQEDAAGFKYVCLTESAAAYSCMGWGTTPGVFAYDSYPVAYISPIWHSEPGVIIHELLHAMEVCSGIAPTGDVLHSDPRVWSARGGALSAQSRALAITPAD